MFDHLGFSVTDYEASKAFFLKALAPLGVTIAMEGPYGLGIGHNGKPSFWMSKTDDKPSHLHLAFTAAFTLDHELGANRKPTGKTPRTVRHGNLLQHRHPDTPMCRSIDPLHGRRIYPRYPQWRTCHAPDGPISPPHV